MTRAEWNAKLRSCAKEYKESKQQKRSTLIKPKPIKAKKTQINKIKAPLRSNSATMPNAQAKAVAKTIYSLEARPYIKQQMQIAKRIRGSIL